MHGSLFSKIAWRKRCNVIEDCEIWEAESAPLFTTGLLQGSLLYWIGDSFHIELLMDSNDKYHELEGSVIRTGSSSYIPFVIGMIADYLVSKRVQLFQRAITAIYEW
jgi:hypothetical protein